MTTKTERMTDEQYLATQEQLRLLSALVLGLDLEGFLARISGAQTMGPILDPTLYRAGSEKLQHVEAHARALLDFQRRLRESVEAGL